MRLAAASDAPALSRMAMLAFSETFHHYEPAALAAFFAAHYSPEFFRAAISDKHTQLWLAEDNGDIAGYAKFGACGLPGTPDVFPALELHRLYVLKSHQGKKIGAALMEKFFAATQAQGAKAAYLGVWEKNLAAQTFYARYGFEKIGEYDYLPIGKVVDREWILKKIL